MMILSKLKPRQKRYGWHPDLPDSRDLLYRPPKALRLPASADLRPLCSPVEDQGQLGSCTANALAGALELLENKRATAPFADLSRLFIYYNERVLEHSVASDSGAPLRDGVKCLAKLGVCKESLWPYAIARFADKPSPACYKDAAKRVISAYRRVIGLAQLRACLASGFPVVFGFTVYASFESAAVAKTGVMPMPKPGEAVLGGHAVLAVGYDDKAKRLLVRNSWGPAWGQQGYFTMPYAYAQDAGLARDFWTIDAEAWPA
jgi:C1A family cysteine protease